MQDYSRRKLFNLYSTLFFRASLFREGAPTVSLRRLHLDLNETSVRQKTDLILIKFSPFALPSETKLIILA